MTRLRILILALPLAACDQSPSVGALPVCRPIAQLAPTNASLRVGQNVVIAVTRDTGCPAPIVRNETPTLLQLDSLSSGSFRATALAVGTGRVRVLAAADTLVTATTSIVVTP
jgi:hypothetical protein